MKKVVWFVLLVVFLAGCNYIEKPKTLLRDPQFAKYHAELYELERAYIHKHITYDEYLTRRKELDDDYMREANDRERILHGTKSNE
ncbi:MAG: hypothetical protein A2Z88_02655 [Omnitrophica WOR_2 bacterium GWA2_47_8]|nr:MAG: hypothetical protein A2Z88_02655 [Omnitrophica WOR_2 bacterium GWA2_47_8]